MPKKNKQVQNSNDDEEKKDFIYATPKGDEGGNEGVIAFCHCGQQMVPQQADTIYEKFMPVFCNDCWSHVPPKNTVYHCTKGTKGRCRDHPVGYDICEQCAKKKMSKRLEQVKAAKNEDQGIFGRFFGRTKDKKSSQQQSMEDLKVNEDDVQSPQTSLGFNLSPTLQCILTQQLHFQQVKDKEHGKVDGVTHLSVIDEVTRLLALSNSTLSVMGYMNKNDVTIKHSLGDLQQMILKYNALEQLHGKLKEVIHDLSVESYKMIEERVKDWREWNKYELCEWIMSLDDGRFYKKYCVKLDGETDEVNVVKESILQQNICGKHLGLDDKKKDILIQSLGINDFDDRLALLDYIESLVNGKFKYDQILALVPPEKDEIPGCEEKVNVVDEEHAIDDDLEDHIKGKGVKKGKKNEWVAEDKNVEVNVDEPEGDVIGDTVDNI